MSDAAAPSTPKLPLGGLARRLVVDGLLAEEAAADAVQKSKSAKQPLVNYIVENGLLDAKSVATCAAKDFGIPLLDLDAFDTELIPDNLVSDKLIRQHHALPLLIRGKQLFVALSDPTNLKALDEIKFNTGMRAVTVLVEVDKLNKIINQFLESHETASFLDLGDTGLEDLDISADEEVDEEIQEADADGDDAPIVRFVHKILLEAINVGASDIHFEPYEKTYRVRFRLDGILQGVANPPVNLSGRLAARLKVMAKLDISERRVPQDGRFKLTLSKHRSVDFRVSTCPTLFGEKVVMRILDPSSATLGVDALGFSATQKEHFLKHIHKPQGMVLVTGPTGSGKTVSLYTALNIVNTPEKNISTVEDPVEIHLAGVNQVNINLKAQLTFSSVLRSFLRQDPDIIMLGEIRDIETAEIAVKAAQTGHLVLSTLHTNSAPETLMRLINMGVPSFNLATSVSMVLAQRLARRLCNHCKVPLEIPEQALLDAGFFQEEVEEGISIFGPKRCEHCIQGYKGRVGLYEAMPVSEGIAKIIMDGGNAIDIAEQARREGMYDLHRSGLEAVKQGITSLEEISRVVKE